MVTSNRVYLPHAKALVFHWRDISTLPDYRLPDQLWTLYNMEAPTNTPQNLWPTSEFNLTASYRMDSDIYVPYGLVDKRREAFNLNIDVHNKSKMVAWFVSDCDTPGHREWYVEELAKYIQVNVYGKCGNYTCEPRRSPRCWERVAKEYWFYLSFENSVCRDYVTEKLFDALTHNIVPVVFGGARYDLILPHMSYVDANRLTPHQLADRLASIARNRTEYLRYFRWKHHFRVHTSLELQVFCQLCRRLNQRSDYGRLSQHTGAQVSKWWFTGGKCRQWVGVEEDEVGVKNVFY
ncbi:unnamed protein product [Oppiella nova]|uniref:Fucosyltransferase n=1 Tax=Oppiella nova TaxID=334625 RepID=A0A7R9LB95_9ACAR|nr:unnamed protein product [Oppiella nova]CAG2161810.1 unnamed protein product [Oppiella nova]